MTERHERKPTSDVLGDDGVAVAASRLLRGLLSIARFFIGLTGVLMVLQAIAGVVRVFIDAPWWIGLYAMIGGFVGYLIAFGAFHHFPWERDPRVIRQPLDER